MNEKRSRGNRIPTQKSLFLEKDKWQTESIMAKDLFCEERPELTESIITQSSFMK